MDSGTRRNFGLTGIIHEFPGTIAEGKELHTEDAESDARRPQSEERRPVL
jgi:hypothetical protein